ncbi:MAG: glycosyltransferase family 87 protein, partial [Ktedonobacterales bacterium]
MRSIRPRVYALPACLVGLAATYWAIVAIASIEYIQPRGYFSDFAHFYAAARALRMGIGPGIYSTTQLLAIDRLPGGCAGIKPQTPYNNPPLLAMLLQPLTVLPCGEAFRLWRLISLAIWTGATLLIAWQVWQRCTQRGAPLPRAALAAAFIVTLSTIAYPVFDGLWLGQVHLLILGGLVLAWWLREHNQPVAAGLVLAVITVLKLLPAVLIVYFLLRRDWRVLVGAAVGSMLLLGVM